MKTKLEWSFTITVDSEMYKAKIPGGWIILSCPGTHNLSHVLNNLEYVPDSEEQAAS